MARNERARGWAAWGGAWALIAVMACWEPGAGAVSHAAEAAANADEKQVTVEAEGTGATKMDALQNAWMEAVRQGVGMFMTAKTELVDDKLTEKIVTHSKGQVNAYQVIEERKDADGWHLKIKAKIDKDILQESAQTVTDSQKVAFDGKDLAAQKVTQQEKQKSTAELWKEIEPLLDFRKCLKYRFTVEKVNLTSDVEINRKKYPKGTNFIFGSHILTWDLAKFEKQKNELEKLLDQVAQNKHTIQYNTPNLNRHFLKRIKEFGQNNYHINWEDEFIKENRYYSPRFWEEVNGNRSGAFNAGYSPNLDRGFLVVKNHAVGDSYTFSEKNSSDWFKRVGLFSLQFYITNDEGLESIALYSETEEVYIGGIKYSIYSTIAPVFATSNTGTIGHTIDYIQPLMDLTPEQLTNIKSLNAGYTLKPVK